MQKKSLGGLNASAVEAGVTAVLVAASVAGKVGSFLTMVAIDVAAEQLGVAAAAQLHSGSMVTQVRKRWRLAIRVTWIEEKRWKRRGR